MRLHDAMHNRQAKARSGALGRIQQRRERPLLLFLRHALAGVPELDDD